MIAPVVREVVVPASPANAFRRFTDQMETWWPRKTHSVHEEACDRVVFEPGVGGRIYEVSQNEDAVWGTVVHWDPPRRVVFTWHPGREPSTAQEVEVTFEETSSGTRVRLVHRGWEALGEKASRVWAQYEKGWVGVLDQYLQAFATASV
jgi:uncharacterized protein YndB with AHSA1/START domain